MEVNPSRAIGILVRMETYTIVESNSEFFIPPTLTVVCVVDRHRNPAFTSICNLHFFSSYRESRFAITIAQIYEYFLRYISIHSSYVKFRTPKKIPPISIQITFFYTKYISKFLKVTFVPHKILLYFSSALKRSREYCKCICSRLDFLPLLTIVWHNMLIELG